MSNIGWENYICTANMALLHPKLSCLNKQSTETQIIEEIRLVLASCNGIKSISHIRAIDDVKSRRFIIDFDNSQNQLIALELLGGQSSNCRLFAETTVLLEIPE